MKNFRPVHYLGLLACLLLIIVCFFNWAYYPDIKTYFTGFYTKSNYYGKPGILLSFIAGVGLLTYLFRKNWLHRVNLIFAALGLGYAIKTFLLFTSSYDGYFPTTQPALYVMMVCAATHLVVAGLSMNSSARMADERAMNAETPTAATQ